MMMSLAGRCDATRACVRLRACTLAGATITIYLRHQSTHWSPFLILSIMPPKLPVAARQATLKKREKREAECESMFSGVLAAEPRPSCWLAFYRLTSDT